MNVIGTLYSVDVLKELSESDLYKRLFHCWGITNGKIEVWGELELNSEGTWAGIDGIKTISENREITYPVDGITKNIADGVYIHPQYAAKFKAGDAQVWIKCELELSPQSEREKQNNPLSLQVKRGSAQRLKQLPFVDPNELIETDNASFISQSVFDYHANELKDQIESKKAVYEKQKKQLQEHQKQLNQELATQEEKIGKARNDIVEHENILERANGFLEKTKASNQALNEDKEKLEKDIRAKKNELELLFAQNRKVNQEMANKIEKLKSYISEKALFLKNFEFIDADDFDSFLFEAVKERDTEDMLSFQDALEGDYKQAVSYIQAYLKEQDILYPRHIIENYLTLIRSNDLIVLAGDSGSGKTNLVQSFAKAVGGVSIIIPVKPNWTSSEDLLGYYNPLEKKYLATPFLEALIEAQRRPEVPYFICLDEMNLARVEYYFADFLSKLEDREKAPEIQLYSDDESAHVLSELKAVVTIISDAKAKYSQEGVVDFVKLMQDDDVNAEMKRAFGFSEKDSLIKYHGDIRRMLSGIFSTPSTISIPANVRIIGAINIDETTHYLSPKILDRTHVMKFKSPLLTDWDNIFAEIESYDLGNVSKPIHIKVEELGIRTAYPKFDRQDVFCKLFVDLNREFFDPLGIEFGMRTIRQGRNYLELFKDVNDNQEKAINNFILYKVLPKFTFDGNKQSGNFSKLDLLDKVLLPKLEDIVSEHESIAEQFSSVAALRAIIENAKANDGVVNYWA